MNPLDPTRVIGGRYVVLSELGRGGTGVVWRAEDRVLGRHVAVKELHRPVGLSEEQRTRFRERLLREARTVGRSTDPGIVTVYDVVTDQAADGVLRDHVVMELIEARTLAEVVATSGPLDERAATALGAQLLGALRVAHDSGVLHRDVRPGTVLLTADGRAKLTDFGVVQAADDQLRTGSGYLAPERFDGSAATAAADLWAVGATLFHAVVGHGPKDAAAPPSTPARGPLGPVISGLLECDPRARLSGAAAAALLRSCSAPAAPPLSERLAASVRRRPWVWILVALVVGLAVGLAVGSAW